MPPTTTETPQAAKTIAAAKAPPLSDTSPPPPPTTTTTTIADNNTNKNDNSVTTTKNISGDNDNDDNKYPFYAARESCGDGGSGTSTAGGSEEGRKRRNINGCIFTNKEGLDRFLIDNSRDGIILEYSGFHTVDKAVAFMNNQQDHKDRDHPKEKVVIASSIPTTTTTTTTNTTKSCCRRRKKMILPITREKKQSATTTTTSPSTTSDIETSSKKVPSSTTTTTSKKHKKKQQQQDDDESSHDEIDNDDEQDNKEIGKLKSKKPSKPTRSKSVVAVDGKKTSVSSKDSPSTSTNTKKKKTTTKTTIARPTRKVVTKKRKKLDDDDDSSPSSQIISPGKTKNKKQRRRQEEEDDDLEEEDVDGDDKEETSIVKTKKSKEKEGKVGVTKRGRKNSSKNVQQTKKPPPPTKKKKQTTKTKRKKKTTKTTAAGPTAANGTTTASTTTPPTPQQQFPPPHWIPYLYPQLFLPAVSAINAAATTTTATTPNHSNTAATNTAHTTTTTTALDGSLPQSNGGGLVPLSAIPMSLPPTLDHNQNLTLLQPTAEIILPPTNQPPSTLVPLLPRPTVLSPQPPAPPILPLLPSPPFNTTNDNSNNNDIPVLVTGGSQFRMEDFTTPAIAKRRRETRRIYLENHRPPRRTSRRNTTTKTTTTMPTTTTNNVAPTTTTTTGQPSPPTTTTAEPTDVVALDTVVTTTENRMNNAGTSQNNKKPPRQLKNPRVLSGSRSPRWERMFVLLRAYYESHNGTLPPLLPPEEEASSSTNNQRTPQAVTEAAAVGRTTRTTSEGMEDSEASVPPVDNAGNSAGGSTQNGDTMTDPTVTDVVAREGPPPHLPADNECTTDNTIPLDGQEQVPLPSLEGGNGASSELIKWMWIQRQNYKWFKEENRGPFQLYEEKIQKLEELGFDFGYISWEERLEQLRQLIQEFKEYQNRIAPPSNTTTSTTGGSAAARRRRRAAAESSRDSHNNELTLDSFLETIWLNKRRKGAMIIDTRTTAAATTTTTGENGSSDPTNGNSNDHNKNSIEEVIRGISIDLDHNGLQSLGVWFVEQRDQCRFFLSGKKCKITKQQMEDLFALKLEALNPAKLLQPKISATRSERRKHRREQQAAGKLEEKIRQENEKWEIHFQELVKIYQETGSCTLPETASSELSRWVFNIRFAYREREKTLQGTRKQTPSMLQVLHAQPDPKTSQWKPVRVLTSERMKRLHDMGFVFRHRERAPWISFEDRVEHLKQFKAEFGHLKVPKSYSGIPGLGGWASKQRWEWNKYYVDGNFGMNEEQPGDRDSNGNATGTKKKYKVKQTLTPERVQILDDLGFTWSNGKRQDPSLKKSWDERYEELLQYQRDFGTTIVPQHYSGLGQWVHAQRKHYKLIQAGKSSPMTSEQASKLLRIGFVWVVKGRRTNVSQQQQPPRQPHRPGQPQGHNIDTDETDDDDDDDDDDDSYDCI